MITTCPKCKRSLDYLTIAFDPVETEWEIKDGKWLNPFADSWPTQLSYYMECPHCKERTYVETDDPNDIQQEDIDEEAETDQPSA